MSELDKLIEAVDAGVVGVDECAAAFPSESAYGVCTWHHAWAAHNGSLDAALALHEELLPGWVVERLSIWPGTNGQCTAYLWGTHEKDGERWHNAKDGRVDANGPTPARAWLLAILRAYRSVQA